MQRNFNFSKLQRYFNDRNPFVYTTRAIKRDCFPFWRRLVCKLANNRCVCQQGCAEIFRIRREVIFERWRKFDSRGKNFRLLQNRKFDRWLTEWKIASRYYARGSRDAWWTIYVAECSNIGRATVLVDA